MPADSLRTVLDGLPPKRGLRPPERAWCLAGTRKRTVSGPKYDLFLDPFLTAVPTPGRLNPSKGPHF